ncbi:WYL domain-containing protein [Limibacter armeniacum]|uniref:helix-turn-helix transcriptional regulator n=1 Tax=Limibacter armeniacum TaxID=466084 RepID=UPI002FE672B0
MPINRNALIRYRTIDSCLRNRYRKWTMPDLIEACSEALYEYEGIEKGVSRRTVQADIQMMRSEKLGYNAPIVVVEKKYYTYEDPDYTITNLGLSSQDLHTINEAVSILKQFKGFSHFQELNGMISKLEDKVHTQAKKEDSVIDLDTNENLKGLEYLDFLYQSIIHQKALDISYQSFKAKKPGRILFHPYLLKEYNGRWFVVGAKGNKKKAPLVFLAIDRIENVGYSQHHAYRENTTIDLKELFSKVIGVSANPGQKTEMVRIWVGKKDAPYLLTKPFHNTQKQVEERENGVVLEFEVQLNLELESKLLSYGDRIEVLGPEKLRERIRNRVLNAFKYYE